MAGLTGAITSDNRVYGAAGATASLGRVLGLGHQESLTPHAREVRSVRRNEVTFGTSSLTARRRVNPTLCAIVGGLFYERC
jgi:hypothetical protein